MSPIGRTVEAGPEKQMNPHYRDGTPDDALAVSGLAMYVFLDTYASDGLRADLTEEVLAKLRAGSVPPSARGGGSRFRPRRAGRPLDRILRDLRSPPIPPTPPWRVGSSWSGSTSTGGRSEVASAGLSSREPRRRGPTRDAPPSGSPHGRTTETPSPSMPPRGTPTSGRRPTVFRATTTRTASSGRCSPAERQRRLCSNREPQGGLGRKAEAPTARDTLFSRRREDSWSRQSGHPRRSGVPRLECCFDWGSRSGAVWTSELASSPTSTPRS